MLLVQGTRIPLSAQLNTSPSAEHDNTARMSAGTANAVSPTPLTFPQALALAQQNSPLLKEASSAIDGASAGVQTAKAYTNPNLEFLAGHQSARPIFTPGVPGTLLHFAGEQTIEIPSERRNRIRASELGYAGTRYHMEVVRLALAAEVKRAFYDVVRRKDQLRQANDNLALVEDLRRRVRLEVDVGEKGKLELTRAEAELARAEAAVRSADIQVANARAILKAVIGSTSNELFDATGTLNGSVPLPPLDELRQQILTSYPAFSEADSTTERSRTVVNQERAKRIPRPNLYGEYEIQPDIIYYRFGVSIDLPLWNHNKGPIAEARAGVQRSEASARKLRLEIVSDLERAYDQYQISNEQVEGLQSGSLREAEAAVEAARSAYRFGERGILEVLDAQRVLQGVRSDLLDALFARQSALIDLEELGATQ
jgi:cobalt-zinc-cadmium efflux system outer membrane protein